MLEFNNTIEFMKLIADMDVNMIDPTDKNTYASDCDLLRDSSLICFDSCSLLHWATSFNNAKAVQALIDRNAAQTPNKYGTLRLNRIECWILDSLTVSISISFKLQVCCSLLGKTPVELAMDACDGGDSSYFNVRGLLAVHWQKLRGKA